jgi:hypothetical protein
MGRGTELEKIEKLLPKEYKHECVMGENEEEGRAAERKFGNFWIDILGLVMFTCIPGHFFNIEHSPYLFPMFSFKKHRSMHVCNHVTKVTKISTD